MAKFRKIINSFIAGQISPTAFGRTDLPQYQHAAKTLKNVIPLLSGGVYRRPGTLFDHALISGDFTYPRLIPFVVSQAESYMLSLYQDNGAAGPFSGILAAHRSTDNFIPSTASTVTGNHPYNYNLSYAYDLMMDDIQYAQSVDVMTLVHPLFKPQRIYRTGVDAFTIVPFDNGAAGLGLQNAWPYRPQNTTAITLSVSATAVGAGRTVTASAAFFNVKHIGAVFKHDDGAGTVGSFKITAYTSPTSVTATVIVALGTTGARQTWWESAWSDYRGWPRSVGFFQQRIVFGGNATDRDSLWFSQTANYDVLSVPKLVSPGPGDGTTTGALGSQPFTLSISSQQLNQIQWISPDKNLVVGTLGEEYFIDIERPDATTGFGADNCSAHPQSHFGSSYNMPVRVGSELIFSVRSGDSLKSLVFNILQNAYTDESIQLLFDQYPKPDYLRRTKYRGFAWDGSRSTLWCVDSAGNLFGMTRDKVLQVTAWHTHQLGGYDETEIETGGFFSEQLCSGSVVSVGVIPNNVLGTDDVWVTVKRKINGGFQFHVERIIGRCLVSDSIANAALAKTGNYFVDSAVYDTNSFLAGTPEDHASQGLVAGVYDHLEGEAVEGTADSSDVPPATDRGIFALHPSVVTAGEVPLTSPYPPQYESRGYQLAYGLPYTPVIEPVRIEAGSQIGTAQAAIKRIHKATLRLYRTLSAKVGSRSDNVETLIFREGSTPMNASPELFTGDKDADFEGDYDREGYIYITQDKPVPFALVSVIAEGDTYD